jgi:hypothetical protein
MSDTQRAERVRSLLRAQIVFNRGATTIDCVVKNISHSGVRIEVAESVTVPDEFDLRVPHRNRTYRVKMVRRSGGVIGGHFLDEYETMSAADLNLEQENIRLRGRVRELTRRLEDLGQDPNSIDSGW